MLPPYRAEPYSDFTDPRIAERYEQALRGVRASFGERSLLVIGGERIDTKASIESVNPSSPSDLVGSSASGSVVDVDVALDAAWDAFPEWSRRTAEERAGLIHRVGDLIAERRFDFAANLLSVLQRTRRMKRNARLLAMFQRRCCAELLLKTGRFGSDDFTQVACQFGDALGLGSIGWITGE